MRYAGVNAAFTYDSGQTTTLGVGISALPNGGFTADGSFSWGSNATIPYYQNVGPSTHLYQSQWQPGVWRNDWSLQICGKVYYTVSPHHFVGSAGQVKGVSIPNAAYCSDLAGAPSITKNTTTSDAFTAGLGWTMPEIGFNANAQTGWDSSNSLMYIHTEGGDWHVCGLHDFWPGHPGQIVAGVPG